jgi:hypothetical protein
MSISLLALHKTDSGAARKVWSKRLSVLRAFAPLTAHQNAWPRHSEPISTHAPQVPLSPDMVALKPHMTDDELALFESLLGRANHVLEYGCGGSTLLAASYKDLRLFGVESDPVWLRKVEAHPALKGASATGRFSLTIADMTGHFTQASLGRGNQTTTSSSLMGDLEWLVFFMQS